MAESSSASVSATQTVETIPDFVKRLQEKGMAGLVDEFAAIRTEKLACTTTECERNAALNRYGNITLLDDSRVLLNDGLPGHYIHASWVDGYKREKAYIISQAPVPASIVDYWRMVWQERITLIVCLTSVKERGQPKADVFFPLELTRPFRAGPFRILAESITPSDKFPRVTLVHLRFRCWIAKKTHDRLLLLVYYGNWPDTAVPQDTSLFLKFVKMIRHLEDWTADRAPAGSRPPPALIHCSAGVGRSASLVAALIATDQLAASDHIDIQGLVRRMRRQRAMAVQNVLQYIFLNLLVLEAVRTRLATATSPPVGP